MAADDFAQLKARAQKGEAGLELVINKRHLTLPWSFVGKVSDAVHMIFGQQIKNYLPWCDGVVMSYGDLDILDNAKVVEDHPCLHVDIKLSFVVFRPQVGGLYKGKVTHTDSKKLTVKVHGFLSIFLYKDQQNVDKYKIARPGDFAIVKLTKVAVHRKMVYMSGELLEIKSKRTSLDTSTNDEDLAENGPSSSNGPFLNGHRLSGRFDPLNMFERRKSIPTPSKKRTFSSSDEDPEQKEQELLERNKNADQLLQKWKQKDEERVGELGVELEVVGERTFDQMLDGMVQHNKRKKKKRKQASSGEAPPDSQSDADKSAADSPAATSFKKKKKKKKKKKEQDV